MVLDREDLPAHIRATCDAFDEGLATILGSRFVGLYVFGSTAFPPSPVLDIDFHALVDGALDDEDRRWLTELHARLARDYPLGDELDGYYITLEAARLSASPRTELRPDVCDDDWALHRAHIHAGRFVLLRGPDPRELVPAPQWAELDDALLHGLEWLERYLDQEHAYCVLNLCRILLSYETRDVVLSKFDSAQWAFAALPTDWHELIRAAMRSYLNDRTEKDRATLEDGTRPFWTEMCERIMVARAVVGS